MRILMMVMLWFGAAFLVTSVAASFLEKSRVRAPDHTAAFTLPAPTSGSDVSYQRPVGPP